MSNLYWVGIRKSDLLSIESLYMGSITYFGDNKGGNISLFNENTIRKNHNQDLIELKKFYKTSIKQVCEQDSEAKFMFYNPQMAFFLEEPYRERIICLNNQNLLRIIDDKMLCKLWLKNTIPLLESVHMLGAEISLEKLKKIFAGKNEFIIQSSLSSGGYGTYILNSKTVDYINMQVDKLQIYSVTPFFRNAIPINIHCVIYEEEIQLYPMSLQIIKEQNNNLIYRGCDFIVVTSFSQEIYETIKLYSNKICQKMQSCGYLGVCGIDFMIINNEVYFSEVNARFQYSTSILNLGLLQNNFLSVNQATINAFERGKSHSLINTDINCSIPYSSYSYIKENGNAKFNDFLFERYFTIHPEFSILKDGYACNECTDTDAYLFRTVFPHSINGVFNNEIRLNELLTGYSILEPHNIIQLKTMLMTFGVTISFEALSFISEKGKLRDANFSAIDIIIGNIVVNAPYHINHAEYSPFYIDFNQGDLFLHYFDRIVSKVNIYYESSLNNKQTISGVNYSSVVFLTTDRLRINYNPICYYKNYGEECIFCNLPTKNQLYSFNDVKEIVEDYLQNEEFRHILIGGGSNKPNSNFKNILNLIGFLKEKTSKPLYLMSVPPDDLTIIRKLYESGLDEVAFNIEIFNNELAVQYMPGKAQISREHYLDALDFAVQLWGKNGHVRSMLILGLEPEESFLEGIEILCKIGVQPMISIFRPMPNTPLENWLPFSINKMVKIYTKAKKICDNYGQILGPSCVACQNNTLS